MAERAPSAMTIQQCIAGLDTPVCRLAALLNTCHICLALTPSTVHKPGKDMAEDRLDECSQQLHMLRFCYTYIQYWLESARVHA